MNNLAIGVIGQLLIGDALTNLLVPREHMLLWHEQFPEGEWKTAVRHAAEVPEAVRFTAIIEGLVGVYLIYHAVRDVPRA